MSVASLFDKLREHEIEIQRCPDRSSVMDSEADLRHRAPVLGNGRGPREVGPRHIPGSRSVFEVAILSPMLEIDIGPHW